MTKWYCACKYIGKKIKHIDKGKIMNLIGKLLFRVIIVTSPVLVHGDSQIRNFLSVNTSPRT